MSDPTGHKSSFFYVSEEKVDQRQQWFGFCNQSNLNLNNAGSWGEKLNNDVL